MDNIRALAGAVIDYASLRGPEGAVCAVPQLFALAHAVQVPEAQRAVEGGRREHVDARNRAQTWRWRAPAKTDEVNGMRTK